MEENKIEAKVKPGVANKTANPNKKGLLGINYQWITGNMLFFLFLALLAVVYIANGHMADKTIREMNRTARELKELQYEYKTLKSEMMFKSRETEMQKAAEPLGLKVSSTPPVRIKAESSMEKRK